MAGKQSRQRRVLAEAGAGDNTHVVQCERLHESQDRWPGITDEGLNASSSFAFSCSIMPNARRWVKALPLAAVPPSRRACRRPGRQDGPV